ncbi:MAG: class I SAM-dependent methyltransferase [Comamonadaceae bacterium]|nr:MAG: class I SAM-dependent methyltransferase [Comamonadaceae bacterium]
MDRQGAWSARSASLARVGQWLQGQGYQFITVTPATHASVLRRRQGAAARDIRDVFGWSMPFAEGLLPPDVLATLQDAALVSQDPGGLFRAAVRYSTLGPLLCAHSAFPTEQNESVFFGPDTYRFAALIQRELGKRPLGSRARILDVGCGSGAGGLIAATSQSRVEPRVILSDISATALVFARASAALAGVSGVGFVQGDLFGAVTGDFDLVVANPPYLNDEAQRLYRHGGGRWGEDLSLRIVREGVPRLAPGGRLVLYTGAAIAGGVDSLQNACRAHLSDSEFVWSYEELDPDLFGEELRKSAYADVDRIAAVALTVRKP